MAEKTFTFGVDLKVTDNRRASRSPYIEGLLALRGIEVAAVDRVQAELRATQVLAALEGPRG